MQCLQHPMQSKMGILVGAESLNIICSQVPSIYPAMYIYNTLLLLACTRIVSVIAVSNTAMVVTLQEKTVIFASRWGKKSILDF